MNLIGRSAFRSQLSQIIGRLAAKHVFRSQIYRKRWQPVQGYRFQAYFSSPDFLLLIQRAAYLIKKDVQAAEVVGQYIESVVEVGNVDNIVEFGRSGMLIGVYYDGLPSDADSEVAEVSIACALVQFAVCRKLLFKLNERCPNRQGILIKQRIKRISIRAMHAFIVRAELGERYAYEIECKLKNGAFDC